MGRTTFSNASSPIEQPWENSLDVQQTPIGLEADLAAEQAD